MNLSRNNNLSINGPTTVAVCLVGGQGYFLSSDNQHYITVHMIQWFPPQSYNDQWVQFLQSKIKFYTGDIG